MCFQRLSRYNCGCVHRHGHFCDNAISQQSYADTIPCHENQQLRQHVDQHCGDGGLFCKASPDGTRLQLVQEDLKLYQRRRRYLKARKQDLIKIRRDIRDLHKVASELEFPGNITQARSDRFHNAMQSLSKARAGQRNAKNLTRWIIQQLRTKATHGINHFTSVLPAAAAADLPAPMLIFPADTPAPDYVYPPLAGHGALVNRRGEPNIPFGIGTFDQDSDSDDSDDSDDDEVDTDEEDNAGNGNGTQEQGDEDDNVPEHVGGNTTAKQASTTTTSAAASTAPIRSFPITVLKNHAGIAEIPIDIKTGDRSTGVAELAKQELGGIWANIYDTYPEIDPSVPVTAKRSMAKNPKRKTKGAKNKRNSTKAAVDDIEDTPDQPASRPRRNIQPVSYVEGQLTDAMLADSDDATSTSEPQPKKKLILRLKTATPASVVNAEHSHANDISNAEVLAELVHIGDAYLQSAVNNGSLIDSQTTPESINRLTKQYLDADNYAALPVTAAKPSGTNIQTVQPPYYVDVGPQFDCSSNGNYDTMQSAAGHFDYNDVSQSAYAMASTALMQPDEPSPYSSHANMNQAVIGQEHCTPDQLSFTQAFDDAAGSLDTQSIARQRELYTNSHPAGPIFKGFKSFYGMKAPEDNYF